MDTSSGLFIEEIAFLTLYDAEWNIILGLNLSYYTEEIHNLKVIVKEIIEIKSKIDQIPVKFRINETNDILYELLNMLDDIQKYNHHWFSLNNVKVESTPETNRRKKRSLLPVGDLFKFLFGSLSENDGEKYREIYEELRAQSLEELDLSKMRTSILESSVEQFENLTKMFNKKKQIINIKILNIIQDLQTFKSVENKYTEETWTLYSVHQYRLVSLIFQKYRSLVDFVILVFQQFYKSQKLFLKSLTVTQVGGSNSPYLIPPKILLEELKKIQDQIIQQQITLPFEAKNENLGKFYQLSTIYSEIINGFLYIKYSVPLVGLRKFLLHKITSFPFSLGESNLFSFVIPRYEYIAIDEDNNRFFITLTNKETQSCFHTFADTLLCKNTFPIFNANLKSNCELNILLRRNDTSSCDLRIINSTADLWIKLEKPNTYLYNVPSKQRLQLICPNTKTSSAFIENAGIIKLREGCTVSSENVRITGFETIETNEVINLRTITPSINFHINVANEVHRLVNENEFEIPQIDYSYIIGNGEIQKLHDISASINDLYKYEKQTKQKITPKTIKNDLVWIFIIILIFFIITTFIVLKYGYKFYQKLWVVMRPRNL